MVQIQFGKIKRIAPRLKDKAKMKLTIGSLSQKHNDIKIKILLVDDHKILRNGLRLLLEANKNMIVVGGIDNNLEVIHFVRRTKPEFVIIDACLFGLKGVETTRKIHSEFPTINIIALSMFSNQHLVSSMLKAGASAYLLKNCGFDDLIKAINTTLSGKIFLCHEIADSIINNYARKDLTINESLFSSLTAREKEILQLLTGGASTKDMAFNLNLSSKTIESHRTHIKRKLKIQSVAELTKFSIREGLTPLEK